MTSERDNVILHEYKHNYNDIPLCDLLDLTDDAFEEVLKKGYDINKIDEDGDTILSYLNVSSNKIKIAIRYGIDVNARVTHGITLLQEAVEYPFLFEKGSDHVDILQLLLDHGANLWDVNINNHTIFDIIRKAIDNPEYRKCYCDQIPFEHIPCGQCISIRYNKEQMVFL